MVRHMLGTGGMCQQAYWVLKREDKGGGEWSIVTDAVHVPRSCAGDTGHWSHSYEYYM